jgi:hypothetical protein
MVDRQQGIRGIVDSRQGYLGLRSAGLQVGGNGGGILEGQRRTQNHLQQGGFDLELLERAGPEGGTLVGGHRGGDAEQGEPGRQQYQPDQALAHREMREGFHVRGLGWGCRAPSGRTPAAASSV